MQDGSLSITPAMSLDVAEIRRIFCEKRIFFSRLRGDRIFFYFQRVDLRRPGRSLRIRNMTNKIIGIYKK